MRPRIMGVRVSWGRHSTIRGGVAHRSVFFSVRMLATVK